jgi:hypothetical protein
MLFGLFDSAYTFLTRGHLYVVKIINQSLTDTCAPNSELEGALGI